MDERPVAIEDLMVPGSPFDPSDRRSLYNIMPREARAVFKFIDPRHLLMSEEALREIVKPSPMINHVRAGFWQEYDYAMGQNTTMTVSGVFRAMGYSSPSVIIQNAIADPTNLAWVLRAPMHYDTLIDEALTRGLSRMSQILDLAIIREDGTIDYKAGELIMKATAWLDIRKNGMPTQRIDQTTRNMNINVTRGDMKTLNGQVRPAELDQRIKELEKQLGHE